MHGTWMEVRQFGSLTARKFEIVELAAAKLQSEVRQPLLSALT